MASTTPAASRVLVLLVGWTLFVFAHSYLLTLVPLACGIALLALLRRPAIGRGSDRFLDAALILSLVAMSLQLVPLSAGFRSRLSPAAMAYDRTMHFDVVSAAGRPLSIDPTATLLALVSVTSVALLFWSARTMFQRGSVRATTRAVVWIGLFLSPLAIVQHLMPLPYLDAAWGITVRGLRPYGPFVNRNDFAAWLIMALPLTLGYAAARAASRHRPGERFELETALDSKSLWLGTALCLMLAGVLFSQSRSGLLGAFVSLVYFAWRSRQRLTTARATWAIAGFSIILGVAATFADMGALSTRMQNSVSEGVAGRLSIWSQTVPALRDFWPLGAGAGTYQAVMVRYQTMSRLFHISHADNELLQILAEGGLLLGLPVALTLVAGTRLVAKRLREDRTAIFWLRLGASAGMLALFTQNMVEMTLRVPANGVLFAILAAIAMHDGGVSADPASAS
jgi:hypothetical protein